MSFISRNKKTDKLHEGIKNDSFDFEQIERYFREKKHSGSFQKLSAKTCNDIDFQELFQFIDRTSSKVGQQFLYDKLRSIPLNQDDFPNTEALISELIKNPGLQQQLKKQISKLNHEDAYYITSLFQEEHAKPPKWYSIIRLLAFTSVLSLILLFINPNMVFVLAGVFIVNMFIHYWNKRNVYQYLNSIPQLLKLNNVAKELYKTYALKVIKPNLTESIEILNKVRNRMSFFKLEAKIQGDMEAIFWGIMELFKILFIMEPLLLFGVLKELDSKRKEIEDVFQFVGEVDSLLSIIALRQGLEKYCLPEFIDSVKIIAANEVYHPLIENCVCNSIKANKKSVLLTGSNMSGKTSFIRTIAINAITAQTINTCFAEKFVLPRMNIRSAIRISDDLMNDKSYYFEEVITIKEMIDSSSSDYPNLFLLDEIFKGTNTIERISAGKAVLSALAKNNNIVFVSTHDIELADLLEDEFGLYHFSEIINENTVGFDYKIKAGKLKNRNALRILQMNGYPEEVIQEALNLSATLDMANQS